ncbi:MAG: phage holin family protein [Actinomycetota bacterium]
MAEIQDIPRLVKEFFELSKAYLLQETVEPAKKLGHFAGLSLGAALLWGTAIVLLAVAGLRALYDVLPSSAYWEAASYIVFAVVLIAVIAVLVKLAPDRGVHDGQPKSHVPMAAQDKVQTEQTEGADG